MNGRLTDKQLKDYPHQCSPLDLAAEALARGQERDALDAQVAALLEEVEALKARAEKAEAQIEADADAMLVVTQRAESAEAKLAEAENERDWLAHQVETICRERDEARASLASVEATLRPLAEQVPKLKAALDREAEAVATARMDLRHVKILTEVYDLLVRAEEQTGNHFVAEDLLKAIAGLELVLAESGALDAPSPAPSSVAAAGGGGGSPPVRFSEPEATGVPADLDMIMAGHVASVSGDEIPPSPSAGGGEGVCFHCGGHGKQRRGLDPNGVRTKTCAHCGGSGRRSL